MTETSEVALPGVDTVFDLLTEHATARPAAPAVVAGDRQRTCAELDEASVRWAATLQAHHVAPRQVIGVCRPRTAAAISASLGVLRAGAVLLMLDPAHPFGRRNQILTEVGCTFVVTDVPESFSPGIVTLSRPESGPTEPASCGRLQADDASYVVFTSGSTGTLKGVLCDHGGLTNMVHAQQVLLGREPGDRVAQIAPFTVDAFIFELMLALSSGASLHVADETERELGRPLRRFLHRHDVSVLVATPTALLSLEVTEHAGIRLLVSAGEALEPGIAAKWAPRRQMVNAYGPTEATVWTTAATISGAEAEIPLGEPIPGVRVEVLRQNGTPCGIDEVGELCISGVSVAKGYINTDSEVFLDTSDGRMYRTGDRVVRRADRTLMFVGRGDDQIKLGGLRIELGELRHHLLQHPSVRDAVVRLQGARLVAYVTGPDESEVTSEDLLVFLDKRLPRPMVPTSCVFLDRMPTTPWGKIDVSRLPSPSDPQLRQEHIGNTPRTPVEEYLVMVVQELLDVTPVSVTDDLFDLGLNSIIVARLTARIFRRFGVEFGPVDIFANASAAALAECFVVRMPELEVAG